MGNDGIIGPGDVQWMTAGSGIIHQEMPKGDKKGSMGGFQLWANLPASHKMMDPRYRGLTNDEIPEVPLPGGACQGHLRRDQGDQGAGQGHRDCTLSTWTYHLPPRGSSSMP